MSRSDLEETSSGPPQPARFRAQQDKKRVKVVRKMNGSLEEAGLRQRPRPRVLGDPGMQGQAGIQLGSLEWGSCPQKRQQRGFFPTWLRSVQS